MRLPGNVRAQQQASRPAVLEKLTTAVTCLQRNYYSVETGILNTWQDQWKGLTALRIDKEAIRMRAKPTLSPINLIGRLLHCPLEPSPPILCDVAGIWKFA